MRYGDICRLLAGDGDFHTETMRLGDYTNVHCVGIGGIGLSAIARYCASSGAFVSGSDGAHSRIVDDLVREGIRVHLGHDASHVPDDCDLLIHTIAVGDSNPEVAEAKHRGIPVMTYPEALGLLTMEYTTIAVCGTHGKTTTTAMVAGMLKACGKSPTVIVGSLLSEGGTNFIKGDSEYLVVEACEYRRSFLNLNPTHIIVTNIDADHMDYYKDMADIISSFESFVSKLSPSGYLITHGNVHLATLGKHIDADAIDRGSIELSVFGEHNKGNAQLACALADVLGLDEERAREGLKAFKGTWRRMEYKGITSRGAKIYDDYGHHPTEIAATVPALRNVYPKDTHKLHVFFQPHLYSRTKLFLNDFVDSLKSADRVYALPIYAAREEHDPSITHEMLVSELAKIGVDARSLAHLDDMKSQIEAIDDINAVVLNIGAGDAYTILDQLSLTK
jgi:UDP-N-acetylmuramate--alanine ligase